MKETEQKLKGPLFIIFSSLFFSSYGIWSKLMSGFFGEFSQAWIRGLIITFILLVLGIVGKKFKKITKEDWPWFVVTALAGGLNQAPYYYAFEKLELGTATMLFYASLTIGGFFFGKIFFKEKMTSSKIIALILAISGMGLIYGIKISGGFLPLLMAIVAGGMGSAEVVFSKKISHKYSTLQVIVLTFA